MLSSLYSHLPFDTLSSDATEIMEGDDHHHCCTSTVLSNHDDPVVPSLGFLGDRCLCGAKCKLAAFGGNCHGKVGLFDGYEGVGLKVTANHS